MTTCYPRVLTWFIASFATLLLAACGGGSGPQYGGSGNSGSSGGGNGNYFFTFEGVDSSNRKIEMALSKDAQSQTGASGSFDPISSRLTVSAPGDFSVSTTTGVSGTFDGNGFSLTAASSGQTYSGRFVDTDVIELTRTGSTEAYVLTRNANPAFAPQMSGVWSYASTSSRLLQLGPSAGFTNDDVTSLIEGTEFDGGVTTPVTGSASVSRVVLIFHRQGGDERVEGRFGKAGGSWSSQTFLLADGSQIIRGGTPDVVRALFVASEGSGSLRRLFQVDAKGVNRVTLTDGLDVQRFLPSADGTRVAVLAAKSYNGLPDLYVVDRSSHLVSQLTNFAAAGGQVLDAAWTPDSQRLAAIAYESSVSAAQVFVDGRAGGARTPVANALVRDTASVVGLLRVAWSASGDHLAFVANLGVSGERVSLHVTALTGGDLRTLWPGSSVPVVDFAWASKGDTIAFRSQDDQFVRELWTADVAALLPPNSYSPTYRGQDVDYYVWSPDGMALAFVSSTDPNGIAWMVDVSTSTFTQVSAPQFAPSGIVRAIYWSPDSTSLAYLPSSNAGWVVFNGSTSRVLNDIGAYACGISYPALSWSNDGNKVAYLSESAFSECKLTTFSLVSNAKSTHSGPLNPPTSDRPITWLPDGHRIVFAADPQFRYEDDLWIADERGTTALKLSDLPDGYLFLDQMQTFWVQ